jgi:hypothetical protein
MVLRKSLALAAVLTASIGGFAIAASETPAGMKPVTIVPAQIDPTCRKGKAKSYDECSDQLELYEQAKKLAAAEGKTLLVVYGAEWCMWCHVFTQHVKGVHSSFTYTYGSPKDTEKLQTSIFEEGENADALADAKALNAFVAQNFVLLEVEANYAPNGEEVLGETGAFEAYKGMLPFIYSAGRNGYAATLNTESAELPKVEGNAYRGYDRKKLLTELRQLHAASRDKTAVR